MNYLHEEAPVKIIHRDLKLENLLLDKMNNVKVCDFGIAGMYFRNNTDPTSAGFNNIYRLSKISFS